MGDDRSVLAENVQARLHRVSSLLAQVDELFISLRRIEIKVEDTQEKIKYFLIRSKRVHFQTGECHFRTIIKAKTHRLRLRDHVRLASRVEELGRVLVGARSQVERTGRFREQRRKFGALQGGEKLLVLLDVLLARHHLVLRRR